MPSRGIVGYGRLDTRNRERRAVTGQSQCRIASALLALAPAVALAQSDGGTIHLGVGQQKTLSVPDVQRVAIGDTEVADVKQVGGGNELLLTGVGEGRTSLLVWRRSALRLSYAVVVRKQDPREVISEIRALLGDREGIRVRVVGDRVYLCPRSLFHGSPAPPSPLGSTRGRPRGW